MQHESRGPLEAGEDDLLAFMAFLRDHRSKAQVDEPRFTALRDSRAVSIANRRLQAHWKGVSSRVRCSRPW